MGDNTNNMVIGANSTQQRTTAASGKQFAGKQTALKRADTSALSNRLGIGTTNGTLTRTDGLQVINKAPIAEVQQQTVARFNVQQQLIEKAAAQNAMVTQPVTGKTETVAEKPVKSEQGVELK